MSIRLHQVTGFLEVTASLNDGAIDKNWGEIDKKYWTDTCGDLTLEVDRLHEVPNGKSVRDHSFPR